MPGSKPLLVLWDIDHTLIETRGVVSEVYAAAFQKVTGHSLEQMGEMAGRTEPVIFRDTLALHGINDPADMFPQFAREQAQEYVRRIADLRRRGRALPGALNALSALASIKNVVQSVLTGNTPSSARIKLSAFGLEDYLDLDAGAYGTDDDIRANLVPIARQRAMQRTGYSFTPESMVLIGDTPSDVVAARDGGARIIAVATGASSIAELAAAGAAAVLPDLTSTTAFLAALDPGEPSQ
jgi:phosphoglycolate phosphatase-like HAD superfamily hydrolase